MLDERIGNRTDHAHGARQRLLFSVAAVSILGVAMGCSVIGSGTDCDCCGCDGCGCGTADAGTAPPPLPAPPPPAIKGKSAAPEGLKEMPRIGDSVEGTSTLDVPERLNPEADGLELR